jgi:hypothetical protein
MSKKYSPVKITNSRQFYENVVSSLVLGHFEGLVKRITTMFTAMQTRNKVFIVGNKRQMMIEEVEIETVSLSFLLRNNSRVPDRYKWYLT